MRKVTAVALAATLAAAVWGLSTTRPSLPEPGIKPKEVTQEETAWGKIKRLRYIPAEDAPEFQTALMSMTQWCGEKGLPAEVWVERNAAGQLEVLGRCTRTFRSEGP
jgi:hypothetical protein